MIFYAQLSSRLGKKFSEVSWSRGPLQIGVTGAGTYPILYGSNWLTLIDVNRRLEAYQLIDDEWVNQSQSLLLPPIFDTQLPAGVRRLTHAFDQAARIICAYEDESGIIRVTRWDPDAQEYKQNVSFAGVDPCLLMQTTVDYRIPDSDIWLFYRRGSTIYWRRQGDNYTVENTLFSDSQIGVLDRAQALHFQYQLLVSDSSGAPLQNQLVSEIFPTFFAEPLQMTMAPTGTGLYQSVILTTQMDEDVLEANYQGPVAGIYALAVLETEAIDVLTADYDGPVTGLYQSVILSTVMDASAINANYAVGNGSYDFVVIKTTMDTSEVNATYTGPTGGIYATA